ncbi:unnamed protein product [Sordaria macrospora k-hell]|uniref:WGS project CABT00000000 data, contig 2.19 n=1 Tax=Sordaria macrospora (strain ATCC MYA-333 / DSM 997 / K(L3346) / K-hell) TaxID=771870 RepID=F7W1K9_SORMK|nr:uncharacterized protein SMAC_04351 [Sordaria macrospora k-hell]CCC04984.1 unnamed protein product [Sordaria macrospora k-hell]
MSKKPATEILVHITAPSRSIDDVKYRALANAYHDFEPTTRTSVFSKTISPNVVPDQAVVRLQPVGNRSLGPSTQLHQIIRSSGVAGSVETPVLSWRDAANNFGSPRLRMRRDQPSQISQPSQHSQPTQNSQLSWQPPPSVVQDSLPDNNVTLSQFCTPTRLLEDYLHPSDSSQSLVASPVVERAPRVQESTAARVQSQYEGDSTFPTISPVSQRRQMGGHQSRVAPPPPDSSLQRNSQGPPADNIQRTSSPPVRAAEEPHVSAPSERNLSCQQVGRPISTTRGPPIRQAPADPRAKIIPLSPVVNANRKRRRPSRDSELMIASSQPAAQERVLPADTIITKGPSKPSLSSPRSDSEPPPKKRRLTSPEPASAPTPSSRAAAAPASLTSLHAPSSSATPISGSSTGKHLARSTSDIGPRQDAVKSHQLAERSARLSSVLELYSPCPPTSDLAFDLSKVEGEEIRVDNTSLITPVLAKLAADLNLPKRFQPSLQTRDLRPYERGYWLVDCMSWDRELKESCWSFLADYLGGGAAGWGIWCTRDEGFTRLRMYCWGAVVGHMHLVLYIMSKREVLYTGMEWVDADGEVVIRMEPRPSL